MKFWILAFAIVVVSCGGKNKVPSGILQRDSMEVVLKDLMMVDEFVTSYVSKDTTKNQKAERLRRYEQVFALHKTSREQFKKSLEFYKQKPRLMKDVFDSLSTKPVIIPDTVKPKEPSATIKK